MKIDQLLGEGAPAIVAILRGLTPAEAVDVGKAVLDAGIRIMEVPLNSPDPFDSIARLQAACGSEALVGAGTVLTPAAAAAAAQAGARLIVTPNTDPEVIDHAVRLGLECMPGFFTASEAFAAVKAGATRLKLFPAGSSPPDHIKAVREVLPSGVSVWAVGGTNAATLEQWLDRGAAGIGVGGALYRAGHSADQVHRQAAQLVAAWRAVRP